MLKKTEGIVLNFIKYGDTSIIVRIFTKDFGVQNYIVNGARSAKGKGKISFYQHFTILDLVVYHKENKGGISRIAEIKNSHPLLDIPFNQAKISITLFATDLVYRCLPEQQINQEFYVFLENLIIQLDNSKNRFSNLPIFLIVRLTEHLGLLPLSARDIFNNTGNLGAGEDLLNALSSVIQASHFDEIQMAGNIRKEITDIMILFLGKHYENLHKMQSLDILREVLE